MYWADPKFFWRKANDVRDPMPDNPPPVEPYYDYVPLPCRFLPERLVEYPSVYDLPEALKDRVDEWERQNLSADGTYAYSYEFELSACLGTKIGGCLHVIQWPWTPICDCERVMEHLLTLATTEWNGAVDRRWTPKEEQELFAALPGRREDWDDPHNAVVHAHWMPTGLRLGDGGHMQLFVCRHCPGWPIVPAIECC
jgi:hypothetical protein